MKIIFYSCVFLITLVVVGCGDKGSSQQSRSSTTDSNTVSPSNQQGTIPMKIVSLKPFQNRACDVYIEGENNSQNTLSMTLNVIFKTPQNQVIESSLRVFTARGGQTATVDIGVEEQCSLIGSVVLSDTTTCQLDGKFVNNDICWNQISPQSGTIPMIK